MSDVVFKTVVMVRSEEVVPKKKAPKRAVDVRNLTNTFPIVSFSRGFADCEQEGDFNLLDFVVGIITGAFDTTVTGLSGVDTILGIVSGIVSSIGTIGEALGLGGDGR